MAQSSGCVKPMKPHRRSMMTTGHVQSEKPVTKRLRGFAAMPAERQRAIASAGGRAAHESGNAHEFDTDAAREAGRKGGYKVSENREHMAAIGRKGGRIGGGRRGKRDEAATPQDEATSSTNGNVSNTDSNTNNGENGTP
jgi:uncharacterized protein